MCGACVHELFRQIDYGRHTHHVWEALCVVARSSTVSLPDTARPSAAAAARRSVCQRTLAAAFGAWLQHRDARHDLSHES